MSRRGVGAVGLGAALLAATLSGPACGLDRAGEAQVGDDAAVGIQPREDGESSGSSSGALGLDAGDDFDPGDGGYYPGDVAQSSSGGSSSGGACSLSGTWGSKLTIDVNWMPQGLNSIILANGSGQIKQWIKGVRVQQGNRTTDATVVCGIALPDFSETNIMGLTTGETYGVLFPPSLFDNGYLPTFQVTATVNGSTPGSTYTSSASAALLGITLTNPTTDPWPTTVTTASDDDRDGKPGVTINVNQGVLPEGGSYAEVPVGLPSLFSSNPPRASRLYVAIRQVTLVTGTVQDCNHISGTLTIPTIGGKVGIDSHVIGCTLAAGGDCTTGSNSQAAFVDNTQPVFTPTGTTSFHSLRLPTGATCATLRQMLP